MRFEPAKTNLAGFSFLVDGFKKHPSVPRPFFRKIGECGSEKLKMKSEKSGRENAWKNYPDFEALRAYPGTTRIGTSLFKNYKLQNQKFEPYQGVHQVPPYDTHFLIILTTHRHTLFLKRKGEYGSEKLKMKNVKSHMEKLSGFRGRPGIPTYHPSAFKN